MSWPMRRCPSTFDFRELYDKRLGRLIRFFCGSLGVTRGRFVSMISSTAHPRWSCYGHHFGFGFRRLEDKRLGWLIQFFCGLLGVTGGRFLSMTSTATHPTWPLWQPSWIWFPSIIWRKPSNFFGVSLGVINLHHIPLLPKPCLPHTHRQFPTWGHMPCLA
jgi:hypothetical protein